MNQRTCLDRSFRAQVYEHDMILYPKLVRSEIVYWMMMEATVLYGGG